MYELFILLSKYLFLIYMAAFIWQSIKMILYNKDMFNFNFKKCVSHQYIILIAFHINAFLILCFNAETNSFEFETLLICILSLIVFCAADIGLKRFYHNSDRLIWNSIIFLCDIGLVMLQRLNPSLAQKQLLWLFSGFAAVFALFFALNFIKNLSRLKYIYLILSGLMLIMTLFFGDTEGGAKNWLTIKNITFQPSEPVKLLFIMYLTAELAKPKLKPINIILPTAISGVIVLLLVFQRDLGSALIFFVTYMSVIYITTSSKPIILSGLLLSAIGSFAAYHIFNHIRVRVASWINPWADIKDGGYQITQSLFALATYGFWGSGLNKGFPEAIPIVERDFIFSAICEEFGIIFVTGIIIIFVTIFYSCIKISLESRNRYNSVLVSALTCMTGFQTFLIIGGVTKLIPLTGVTLPFISYGGTSIIICFVIFGMIQWVKSSGTAFESKRR